MAKKSVKKSTNKVENTDTVANLRAENQALKTKIAAIEANPSQKAKKTRTFWRSFGAGLLATIAVVSFTLFNVSYWVKDTIVDTNQFVTTLQPLIKDPAIQKTLTTEITNEVFSQIDLEAELKKALPENLQFIAAPFAGQVKSFTTSKIGTVLNSQQAYDVWTKTLTVSQSRILAYIENPENNGVITVNSVYELAGEQLKDGDVGFLFGKSLPKSVGSIQLANIEGVSQARQVLNTLKQLTAALAIVSVVATALAIALSPRRRNMIVGLAIFTLLFMLCTLASISYTGTKIGSSVEPQFAAAAESVQKIVTAPLVNQTQGIAALIGAVLFIAIVSSGWDSIVWVRNKVRGGLDWVTKRAVRSWGGSQYIDWIAINRVVICWTLVAVSFVAFALRIPPTVNGVKEALIVSGLAAIILEIIAAVSRTTNQNRVK